MKGKERMVTGRTGKGLGIKGEEESKESKDTLRQKTRGRIKRHSMYVKKFSNKKKYPWKPR